MVHFGGPDQPRFALRDLLEARIDAVPRGGWISWATYYFRDEALANALLRAKRRGVRVRVIQERKTRLRKANQAVVEILRGDEGLGRRFVRFRRPKRLEKAEEKPHLHSKIFAFSHPKPHVFVGSFNPSGNGTNDDPAVIAEIGDQDRGHNLLVEIHDRRMVRALRFHMWLLPWLGASEIVPHLPFVQRPIRGAGLEAWLFPRGEGDRTVASIFAGIEPGDRLRVAMSHVKKQGVELLCETARRGARVEIILHHTMRRAPVETAEDLAKAGVEVLRYHHEDDLPMHAKFMLVDRPGDPSAPRFSLYGSLNLNERSLMLNHEILVRDHSRALFDRLDERWRSIVSECRLQVPSEADPQG